MSFTKGRGAGLKETVSAFVWTSTILFFSYNYLVLNALENPKSNEAYWGEQKPVW